MNTYAIDEHYKLAHAVTRLQSISLKALEEVGGSIGVQQLADVKWDETNIVQYSKPNTWRMCYFDEEEGGMSEVQFKVQGILCGKELPPLVNSRQAIVYISPTPTDGIPSNLLQLKKNRRYLRQNVKIYGGQSDVFADAARAAEQAYVQFSGHFADGTMDEWSLDTRQGDPVIEANTRYLSPTAHCGTDAAQKMDDFLDTNGVLAKLIDDDFVYGPENRVEYTERIIQRDGYREISPTQFKIGDIVEAVVAFVCYPTQKGTVKMSIALRGLAMLDHTERDEAAILRMRARHKATGGIERLSSMKRKSVYGRDGTEDTSTRFARMRLDEEAEGSGQMA